jgi:polysaccharide pyruvyl transferase WcaK-like protein
VAYSKKFAGVFKTVGMEDSVIDGRFCDVEAGLEKAMTLFNARERTREPLSENVERAKRALYTTFGQLLNKEKPEGREVGHAPAKRSLSPVAQ